MINITELQPKVLKYKVKHPITGETEFKSKSGEPVELIIHLVGRNSEQWLDVMQKFKDISDKTELFSKISESGKEFIASLIVGWDDNDAVSETYSKEAALRLVSDAKNIWLIDQLQEVVMNESNFF